MRRLIFSTILLAATAFAFGSPPESWTIAEKEHFLETAPIIHEEPIGKGLTKPTRATLSDGRGTHDAEIQTVDIYMPLFKGADGSEEKEFKDTWKFNVAAYRLAKLLHLTNMVPVSVARVVDGKPAAVTWWVDHVLMDEHERIEKKIMPPDPARWRDEMDTVRTFDQLIYNMDRSWENLLIDTRWNAWMIDHTRAFRRWPTLRNEAMITQANPELVHSIESLTRAAVERELKPYVTDDEISGMMARRDRIVQLLKEHMAARR